MPDTARVEQVIREFLRGADKPDATDREVSLYSDGIGLDSMDTAELSAVLEEELGTDPFSEGEMPQTLGEIYDFYQGAAAAPTQVADVN